ncbi:efflux RND transporter periplasmic adaptor subunit [Parasphingorhabdus sp. JC815]|uniref:efflux RND transporter periplasmic adaptor subunit n=1 Tax=Parasphingorhabdus sp. JC815 TaxID=3232140 RepID=UPI00345987F1
MNYESKIAGEDIDVSTVKNGENQAQNKKRLIIVAAVVAALVLAFAVYKIFSGSGKGVEAGAVNQASSVTVVVPGKQDVVHTINATGTLAARRELPVGVVGEGGRVTRVYVDAGDWVKAGQVMASIDRSVQNQQVARLEALVASARAERDIAQANLDRAAKLIERGFISKADIDRLTATRDSSAAQLKVAQAQLAETRARNNFLNIIAPKGGLVLERNIEVGQTVTPGSGILFRLAQSGEMELQALLSESDLANVSVGVSAEVTPVGTDKILEGQIWQISPMIDTDTRQGVAKIALSYDRALRPGGFANAEIKSGSSQASVLPESAVQNDSKGSYVYIVGEDNKVIRRDVVVGDVTSAGLSITSGLSGTERVVLRAAGFLNPGQTVNPVAQKDTAAPDDQAA